MTNKMLYAFNDVSDFYITDALAYRKATILPVKWIAAVACVAGLLFTGVTVVTDMWNHGGGNVQTPQYIYQVGERVDTYYGFVEYVGYTESSVTFKIQSDRDVQECFYMMAYKWIGDTERIPYAAVVGDPGGGFGSTELLTNELTIHMDGVEVYDLIIPGDGKEHEIVIDFSQLIEQDFEMEYSWVLRGAGRFTCWIKDN